MNKFTLFFTMSLVSLTAYASDRSMGSRESSNSFNNDIAKFKNPEHDQPLLQSISNYSVNDPYGDEHGLNNSTEDFTELVDVLITDEAEKQIQLVQDSGLPFHTKNKQGAIVPVRADKMDPNQLEIAFDRTERYNDRLLKLPAAHEEKENPGFLDKVASIREKTTKVYRKVDNAVSPFKGSVVAVVLLTAQVGAYYTDFTEVDIPLRIAAGYLLQDHYLLRMAGAEKLFTALGFGAASVALYGVDTFVIDPMGINLPGWEGVVAAAAGGALFDLGRQRGKSEPPQRHETHIV